MKNRCIAFMMMSIIMFPFLSLAQSVPLTHDDNVYEASTSLGSSAIPGGPFAILAPAVQLDVPGPGYYALESVSFQLLQEPAVASNPDGSPGAPAIGASSDPEPQTYPVTVRIWTKKPSSGEAWILANALQVDLIVTDPGLYVVSLKPQSLIFTDSVRVGISLRDDGTTPIPAIPLRLGVDSDGTDSAPPTPFGHSYRYSATAVSPANPWLPALTANYGIHASVHRIPALSCRGFLPPLDGTIAMTSGGRTIPAKAKLLDEAAVPVTQGLLSPPRVKLLYAPDTNASPAEVTSAAGLSFQQSEDGTWACNLKTGRDFPGGVYTVLIESGDVTEYLIDPACVGTFVIENPKSRQADASGTSGDPKSASTKGRK